MSGLVRTLAEHHPKAFPSSQCGCGLDLADGPWSQMPFAEAHASHVAEVIQGPAKCGGCQGLGAHSPRCHEQPGWLWRRLYDRADSLGDAIGPNDIAAANLAYTIAARMKQKWSEAQ